MNFAVVLFLLGVLVIGFACTYLMRTPFVFEERLVFGAFLGTVQVSLLGFFVAWLTKVDGQMVLITEGILFVAYLPLMKRRWSVIRADAENFFIRFGLNWKDSSSPKTTLSLMLASAIVSARILHISFGKSASGGVTVSHLSVFGDWSAHLAYASSFAYGHNFPPELPTAAGESFSYHFGVDWFAAMLIPLGADVFAAMQVSTFFLATFFPAILYLGCRRFTSNSRASVFAVATFLLSGGTGALYRFLFVDLPEGGISVLGNLPRSYAFDGFDRNWVDNAVTGFLYPQRPTLIGFSAVILVVILLWENRKVKVSGTYIFAGVLTGLLPFFHVFAFGTLILLTAMWAVIHRRKYWGLYLSPALAIGAPIVIWQWPDRDGTVWHFLWMLGKSSWNSNPWDFLWFWLLNTGLFIPLAVWGVVRSKKEIRNHAFPLFSLLVIPNIAIWHFWPGNNAKYVIFFLLLASPFVGEALEKLFSAGGIRAFVAVGLILSLTLTGALDIWRSMDQTTDPYPVEYLSGTDISVGEWIKDNTDPDAIFASANTNTHPVRVLTGRKVISGSPGRLNDLGKDWYGRDQDLRKIYEMAPNFEGTMAKYGTDYVVFGPLERQQYGFASPKSRWVENDEMPAGIKIVYDLGGYQIYDVSEMQ
ncbi:MAG TPA: hypothetical protein QF431_04620 [Acidimicrobiales bacterium]|nr:hypothetical protein [Acidimicrobiales bacterium]